MFAAVSTDRHCGEQVRPRRQKGELLLLYIKDIPIYCIPIYVYNHNECVVAITHEQQVPEAEGKKLAEDFGAVFFETSAKSSTSIEELFVTLGERLLLLLLLYCC